MKTQWAVEPDLDWADHFVKYGYAVVEKLIDEEFIAQSLAEVRALVGSDLPFEQWHKDNVPSLHGSKIEALNKVYEQPGVRAVIDRMFGAPERFSNDSYGTLFMTLHDAAAQPVRRTKGHIDFVNKPIPALGRGFVTQIALLDREPFGGNITIWPSTHRLVQQAVINDAEWRFPANWDDIPQGEPFEFVAEAGDALLFHHLVAHGGNPNCTRMPRLNLHCQCWQDEWLAEIDPEAPNLSPWQRSLALNGYHAIHENEQAMRQADLDRRRELSVA